MGYRKVQFSSLFELDCFEEIGRDSFIFHVEVQYTVSKNMKYVLQGKGSQLILSPIVFSVHFQ